MAVTKTIIDIYDDPAMLTPVAEIITNSDANPVEADDLTPGTEYRATVRVTAGGIDSAASYAYIFYTLPDVNFVGTPSAAGRTAYFSVAAVTTSDVRIMRVGVYYENMDGMTRPDIKWGNGETYSGTLDNLAPNASYMLTPIVEDEFGRQWRNDSAMVSLVTGTDAPTVTLFNIIAYDTSAEGDVTVASNSQLTSLVIRLEAEGLPAVTAIGYTDSVGLQHWTASGLQPDTEYTVVAQAVSTSGSGTAKNVAKTTDTQSDASVELTQMTLSTQYPYDTAHVTAIGTAASLESVGVRFYTVDSHSGSPVADVRVAGPAISTDASGLPAGRRVYGFAYCDYAIGSDTETVWSPSRNIVTAPRIHFGDSWSISANSASGTVWTEGEGVMTAVTVEYRAQGSSGWTAVEVYGGEFHINGLDASTTYELRATATNESGSGYDYYTFTTGAGYVIPKVLEVGDVTATTATVKINIITD